MARTLDENMLKNLVDNLQVSINVFDRKGKRIFVNPYFYHLSGRPKGSKFSSSMATGEDPQKAEYLNKKVLDAMKLDKIFEVRNFFYKTRDKKTRRYFDFTIGPLKDDKGKIIGAYSMVKDVTTRFLARRKIMTLNNDLEKKILERTEKLQSISKEKSMLVSDVAHDIKTILTVIKGNLEILKLERVNMGPLEKECSLEIEKEADKMSQMISNLVFIASSEQYAGTFRFKKINLALLVEELIKKYQNIYRGKIKIINQFGSAKLLTITADRDKIMSLLSNLVENAVKFRRPEAKLWIALKTSANMAHLIFKDNGIGVEKEKINFVFSPFFQAHKTNGYRDKKIERGFGLGLAICKKIVDAHGGKISAKSAGLGKGMTIEIWLPLEIEKK